MKSPFYVPNALILSLFRLLFLLHCNSLSEEDLILATETVSKNEHVLTCNALSERDVTFVPQITAKNQTSLSANSVSVNRQSLNVASKDLQRSLRFWALVASFKERDKVKIETVENSGTESSAQREELKVKILGKHALTIIETNLEKIMDQSNAYVDVIGMQFKSFNCSHVDIKIMDADVTPQNPRVEITLMDKNDIPENRNAKGKRKIPYTGKTPINKKVKRRGKKSVFPMTEKVDEYRVSKMEVLQSPDLGRSRYDEIAAFGDIWDRKDLEFLCRLPFLADVVSQNWLFAKKQASRRSELPRDKFKREMTVRGEHLKCLKGCMNLLDTPQRLVRVVKKKVKTIRSKARTSLASYLRMTCAKKRMVEDHQKHLQHCCLGNGHLRGMHRQEQDVAAAAAALNSEDEVLYTDDEVSDDTEDEDSATRSADGDDGLEDPIQINGFQMDGNEVREFPLVLPSDNDLLSDDTFLFWKQWDNILKEDREKQVKVGLEDDGKCAMSEIRLRKYFFRMLHRINTSNEYENC